MLETESLEANMLVLEWLAANMLVVELLGVNMQAVDMCWLIRLLPYRYRTLAKFLDVKQGKSKRMIQSNK